MSDNDNTFKAPCTYAELAAATASSTHQDWESTLGSDYRSLRHESAQTEEDE